jgi:carboxymethylenebutenolidase
VHEIFGVHEHIQDLCRRLAKAGYFAVAPALFAREGDVVNLTSQDQIMAVVASVPDKQVASDLDATAAWANSTGKADTQRLAITGFCWGGREVWLYAAHNRNLKAAAAWYGVLDWPKSGQAPNNPIDIVGDIDVPVIGLYGGADKGIPVDHIYALRDALKAAGKNCEFIVYPDTPHGFNADYRASYRPDQAKDAWKHMLDWFKSHGV